MKELINKKIKFAYYDPVNDTIVNAPFNSYSWFHELRHRKQTLNTPFMTWSTYAQVYGYYLCIGLLFYLPFNLDKMLPNILHLMGLCMLPYIIIVTLLEADAYIFGTIDWFKHKVTKKYIKEY